MFACAAAITGCGTTSNLKPVVGADPGNIQKYSRVSVLDFGVKTGGKTNAHPERLTAQGKYFAELIAAELKNTKAFEEVSHAATPLPGSLLVSGDITRLTEGSASLRFWIGMGAGSSYFDATVKFADADTAQSLGEIMVDKNSWGLGGGLAAGQTVEVFMREAAKKIAEEVAKAKNGIPTGNHGSAQGRK